MPNRSTGCYLCRSRKIRCDGVRPSCRRCEIRGVKCPGYRIATPGDVEFRDETQLQTQRYGETRVSREQQFRSSVANGVSDTGKVIASTSPFIISEINSSPEAALTTLNSPSANRAQLYNSFYEIFTPKNTLSHERGVAVELSNIGYLRQLAALPNAHPALSHSMSALSLVSAGSWTKDRRLVRQGIEEHTLSLRRLGNALKKPEALHDDHIIATITVLNLCEFYEESNHESNGWTDHSNGLQRILAARGSEDLKGELSATLLANAKQGSFARSVLTRSKDFYDSVEWIQLDTEAVGYDTGTRLPGLLQRHDQLDLTHPSAAQDINTLLSECTQLEHGLRTYLDKHVASSLITSGKRFDEESIEEFVNFADLVADRTLETAYCFPSFTSAVLYTSFWLRMFFLRSTVASLQYYHRQLSSDSIRDLSDLGSPVEQIELRAYIMNLCRSIPFFIEPVNGTIGHICCFFPLVAAAKYFQEHGQTKWLHWIHRVRDRIFDKGISLPSIEGAEMPCLNAVDC